MTFTIRVLGIGMGPQHVTPEVAEAVRDCDYAIALRKGDGDALFDLRRAVCDLYGVELVAVADPARDRQPAGDAAYATAVADWHAARVEALRAVLDARPGTVAMLVWGDPSLYDSTIRVVEQLTPDFDVLPGVSAPQLLAARHRIVLHPVGAPVHVTTARRLRADIALGQRNLVVMLGSAFDPDGLADWSIWWGANLGHASEELVAGRVADVAEEIAAARARAKESAGWVMDLYLLRAPEAAGASG